LTIPVIITSSSDEKLAKAKKPGAGHLLNYCTTPNWDAEVLCITKDQEETSFLKPVALKLLPSLSTVPDLMGYSMQ